MSFVGAASGYVTQWYDQSGNSRHVAQSVASQQPHIVNTGVPEMANSRPAVRFIQASRTVLTNPISTGAALKSGYIGAMLFVMECVPGSSVGGWGSVNDPRWQAHTDHGEGDLMFDPGNGGTARVLVLNSANENRLMQYSCVASASQAVIYTNGTLMAAGGKPVAVSIGTFDLGGITTFPYYHDAHISEFILLGDAPTDASRQSIGSNQSQYFGLGMH